MNFISELIGLPLGYAMYFIYSLVKNYGIAIFIFTVFIRLLMFPLSVKQQKSTAAMSAFQPKLEKLKKQYANNPNKLQEEQMKLYAEEDINPMSSCLPMFFQLFFLYGVFDVVYRPLYHIVRLSKDTIAKFTEIVAPLYEGNSYFTQRPEMYIIKEVQNNPSLFEGKEGITAEMIQKISEFEFKLFGIVDMGAIPKSLFEEGTVWNAAAIGLFLIPVISGVIQLLMTIYSSAKQKRLNPEAASQMGSMNIMLYGMVIFSVYLGFTFPAGIGFYWICSSLVGFIQTFVLNKIYTPEYVAKLIEKDKLKKKNKKRSGFMEKYNEMLQEQLRQQNGGSAADSRIASSGVKRDEETGEEIKLSKSQMKEYERKIIAEARRRQAEKYGDEYIEDDND